MYRLVAVCACLLLCADFAPAEDPKLPKAEPKADPKPDPAARDVKDLIEAFVASMSKKPPADTAKQLAADFAWVTADGTMLDVKGWQDSLKSDRLVYRLKPTGGTESLTVREFSASFQSVKVHNDGAVITGTIAMTDFLDTSYRSRFTAVCFKADGGWKLQVIQVTFAK